MQIIVPMSGIGKRFKDAGYKTPKYLIEIDTILSFKYSYIHRYIMSDFLQRE